MNHPQTRARRAYYVFRVVAPFAFAMWLTIANLYFVTAITGDPFRLAMILVVLETSSFVFEVPTGFIADSFSRKWSMVIGYVIWGGGFLLQALVPIYEVTLFSQGVWGLGFAFVSGAPEAWLVDELGQEEASLLFLRGSQIGQVTTLLGIAASTALATLNLALPIALGGVATILLALLLAVIMPEKGFQPVRSRAMSVAQLRHTFSAALKLVTAGLGLRSIVLIGLVVGSSAGGFDAMYAPHIVENFILPIFEPEIWFGILLAAVTLLTLPVLELTRRRLRREAEVTTTGLLAVFAGGTVVGNLVFTWAPTFYVATLAFCLSQVLRTATKPLFMIWINRQAPSDVRATVISLYWQSNALGHIVFAPILGALGSLTSLRVALSAASVALAPVIPLYLRHRSENPDPASTDN